MKSTTRNNQHIFSRDLTSNRMNAFMSIDVLLHEAKRRATIHASISFLLKPTALTPMENAGGNTPFAISTCVVEHARPEIALS
jgi:hypothetical protein